MTYSQSGPCIAVGKGSVGEPGPSASISHQVTGNTQKLMVLRTTDTSLCPDTGAVAVLVVNGNPVVNGNITALGSSIQTTADPGDWVDAIVHTVQLHNGIVCVRLGELSVQLDECDLVR
jgi:citrate lyase alpha subunit